MYSLEIPIDDSESTPLYVFITDKGYKIHIYSRYNKKDIKNKSVYDYYFEMFTDPKTETQKNFYEQMKDREPKEIKGKDYIIFSYPFYDSLHCYIFSKKLNFAVVVAYPKELGTKIINENTVILR
ncbi:hypothetical protein [Francisella philomiragia]|nr:hypothetical protein [Francisella philomiragia]MBK2255715.1 hypothetical protein [Francisella philomiragia]MBK2274032.1 hypothetical protein [Francisella philomiragia]MBK2277870.1 hypothetical protein [Francisella philomiragia]MBK2281815.1 hypothetical protein [Francisella philomiragia]MBK2283766.1 hypothetical protein [Francisella philomiragia]